LRLPAPDLRSHRQGSDDEQSFQDVVTHHDPPCWTRPHCRA
jgi:hypothetical protein